MDFIAVVVGGVHEGLGGQLGVLVAGVKNQGTSLGGSTTTCSCTIGTCHCSRASCATGCMILRGSRWRPGCASRGGGMGESRIRRSGRAGLSGFIVRIVRKSGWLGSGADASCCRNRPCSGPLLIILLRNRQKRGLQLPAVCS